MRKFVRVSMAMGWLLAACVGDDPALSSSLSPDGADAGTVDASEGDGGSTQAPLASVSQLIAVPLHAKIALTWTNPQAGSFATVTVVRKTASPPSSPADGDVVYQGKETAVTDKNLVDGTTYFYAAFALASDGRASTPATAQATPLPAGTLDPTFNGGKGFVVHAGLGKGPSLVRAVAIDPQGRIVVAGSSSNGKNDDVAVWRFTSAGDPDTTFGANGLFVHDNAAGGGGDDLANGVAIDSKGRILVTGESLQSPAPGAVQRMVLWAVTKDGALDATFNAGKGFVVKSGTGTGGVQEYGSAVIVMTGDKILVGGRTYNTLTNYDPTLWRFNDDGSDDTTFGGGGKLSDDMGQGNATAGINALAIGKDPANGSNKIYAAGDAKLDVFDRRYDLSGIPDMKFGNPNSWVVRDLTGDSDTAEGVAVDSAGNIFSAGACFTPATNGFDLCVWKLDPQGSTAGTVILRNVTSSGGKNSFDWGTAVALSSEGLVVVGSTGINDNMASRLAVWRFSPADLTDDASFAQSGLFTTGGAAGGSDDGAAAVAVDAFGRLVVAGYSSDGSNNQLSVWRIIP